VAVVDDRDNQQCQAHPAGAEQRGVHGDYDKCAGRKFAVVNPYAPCKNRIEFALIGLYIRLSSELGKTVTFLWRRYSHKASAINEPPGRTSSIAA
jgi:hypothetical protein